MKFVFTEVSGTGPPTCLKNTIFKFADRRTQFRLIFLDILFGVFKKFFGGRDMIDSLGRVDVDVLGMGDRNIGLGCYFGVRGHFLHTHSCI